MVRLLLKEKLKKIKNLLWYFHQINILGLFHIPLYFVISLKYIVKLSHLPIILFIKGFHINLMFFFYFIFFYCVIHRNNFYFLS